MNQGVSGKGRVVLITGASHGIGLALLKSFKDQGFETIGVARRPIPEADHSFEIDLTNSDLGKELLEPIRDKGLQVDLLVNNAGVGLMSTWEQMEEEHLRKVFELNFFVPVKLTKLFMPMLELKRGSVVNVASVAGRLPVACMGGYSSSKSALCMFSDTLRIECAPKGVHVLNLVFGRIGTGFSSRAYGNDVEHPEFPVSDQMDQMTAKVLKAIQRKKRELVFPKWYGFLISLARWSPGFNQRTQIKKWKLEAPPKEGEHSQV